MSSFKAPLRSSEVKVTPIKNVSMPSARIPKKKALEVVKAEKEVELVAVNLASPTEEPNQNKDAKMPLDPSQPTKSPSYFKHTPNRINDDPKPDSAHLRQKSDPKV